MSIYRLHHAPAQWYSSLERYNPESELWWLDDNVKFIDELGCRTGVIGAYCQSQGIGWHGWESNLSLVEQAILRVGFDVTPKDFPPEGTAGFLLALFAPLAKVAPDAVADYAQTISKSLKPGGRALIELWWQEHDFEKEPVMETYNGLVKWVRVRKPKVLCASQVAVESHWLRANMNQQPQRTVSSTLFYRHNHRRIIQAFAWGNPERVEYQGRTYLWLNKP